MGISFLSHLSSMKNSEAFNGKMGLNQNFDTNNFNLQKFFKTWPQFCHGTQHTGILKQTGHRWDFSLSSPPFKAFQRKISNNSPQIHAAFPCQQNFSLLHEDIAV